MVKRRKRTDHLIAEQATLGETRPRTTKIKGNLYEVFPPLTEEETIGWSFEKIMQLESIRNDLTNLNVENMAIDSEPVQGALDQYEELERIITEEKKKSEKHEKRILSLISLKEKYRKRVEYLEKKLREGNNLNQAIQTAKALGRLGRRLCDLHISHRNIDSLTNLNVEDEIKSHDPILLAFLESRFKGTQRKNKARLGKRQRLLGALELLNKSHNNNYIGKMWNLASKTAYLRTHSKTMIEYFSILGACGSYSNILKEIKQLPSLDDTIPETGACIVILDNCQNDGKKIYLDRVQNVVDVKVVTAFVTLLIERDNSQDINTGIGPWSSDNALDENSNQKLKDYDNHYMRIFEDERAKFIQSYLRPNDYQKRENDFVENCIQSNEVDCTLSKTETQTMIRNYIEKNFLDDGFKNYSEQRKLFKIMENDLESETEDESISGEEQSNTIDIVGVYPERYDTVENVRVMISTIFLKIRRAYHDIS